MHTFYIFKVYEVLCYFIFLFKEHLLVKIFDSLSSKILLDVWINVALL